MPSFFCLPVSAFAPVKWWLSNSRTSTGELAKSSFAVRGCFMIECLCLPMSERLWHPTCAEIALPAKHAGYLHADMRLKEKALSRTEPLGIKLVRYRPNDQLLAFL